jgi:hypothetical protein
MATPVEFMRLYRNLKVKVAIDDPVAKVCREATYVVRLEKYFMMDWDAGTEEMKDYSAVTSGGKKNDAWFQANRNGFAPRPWGRARRGTMSSH